MQAALKQLAGSMDRTIVRFGIVGAITTTLDFVLFATLVGMTAQPVISNVASYSCGLVVSYLLNRAWTFGVDGNLAQALKFLLFICTGLLLSTVLVALMTMAIAPITAKLISVPIVFFWNYFTSRYLVFQPAPRTRAISD
jgi:putative flippase GtrA